MIYIQWGNFEFIAIGNLRCSKVPYIQSYLTLFFTKVTIVVSREMAVKFNDYFEFPREFDLAPYTAAGLAKKEG